MDDLNILCAGGPHFIQDDEAYKKQFELFPHSKIPDPVSGTIKKSKIPPFQEP
jgi:hypothetical protein